MIAIVITGVFAFLSATDSKTNVFTLGNVKIELIEEFDGKTYNGGVDPKTKGKVVENILPGQTIEKAPSVKNVGSNKAWVYVSVGIPVDNAKNVYTKNGTYTSKTDLTIPITAYAIQEGYGNKTTAQEVWNAYGATFGDAYVDDATNPKVELFELMYDDEIGVNDAEWSQIAVYKTEDYNYYVYNYVTEEDATLLFGTQTADVFDEVRFNSDIGGKDPNNNLVTLSYLTENDNGVYEIIQSEDVAEGTEIDKLYSPDSLSKTGYSLDWHVNSPKGAVATAGYQLKNDTKLYGVYTNLIDEGSNEEYDGAQYLTYAIGYNETEGLYAMVIGADKTHKDYPSQPEKVAIPASINININGDGTITSVNGKIKGFTNTTCFDPYEFNEDYADVDSEYLAFKNSASAGMYLLDSKANGLVADYKNSTLNGQVIVGKSYDAPVKAVTQAWTDVYTEDEETDSLYSEYVALHNVTKKLALPDSIRSISFAKPWFVERSVLEEANIPMNCVTLDADAFNSQELLQYADIGPNVKTIANGAFDDCSGLIFVNIPDSVETIGVNAFGSCCALTSINFGSRVTEIGNAAFNNCNSLTNINLPFNLKTIGEAAFEGCDNLTSIIIPDSVKIIGDSAFESCYNLEKATIGSGVAKIDAEAFRSCTKLSTVNYKGDSAIEIGRLAFDETIFANKANWTSNELLLGGNLIKAKNLSGTYETPDYIKGIAAEAFSGCYDLTNLVISENVEKIGGDLRFRGNISVSSDNETYDSRDNCNAIIETKTNTLISAGSCTTIPNTVTKIGDYAFYGTSLTSIVIPDNVISIGEHAFSHCNKLSSIVLPDEIEVIEPSAFEYCNKLTTVTIPKGIKYIGQLAFYDCDKLTEVIYTGTAEEWNAFCNSSKQRDSYAIMPNETIIQCSNGIIIYED